MDGVVVVGGVAGGGCGESCAGLSPSHGAKRRGGGASAGGSHPVLRLCEGKHAQGRAPVGIKPLPLYPIRA